MISLAGGLPDTSTFPADDVRVADGPVAPRRPCARALQYGPTEGLWPPPLHRRRDGRGGHRRSTPDDLLVTTGGQQVIDLVCKTLIDPGDVIVAEAPTYPGAVPTFSAYQADVVQIEMDEDGMRVDVLEETLDRLEREGRAAEVHLHDPDVPEPGRRDDVAAAAPAARRDRRTSASCSCSRTTRTACCATRASRCRRSTRWTAASFVIYLGTFSKILSPGTPARLGGGARPVLQKMNVGKQAADLCSSSMTQLFVAEYFAARATGGSMSTSLLASTGRGATRCSRRSRALPARGGVDEPERRPVHLGHAARLHRHDRPAGARAERERGVRAGRAAFMDGRGGSSLRLNFSG